MLQVAWTQFAAHISILMTGVRNLFYQNIRKGCQNPLFTASATLKLFFFFKLELVHVELLH